MGDSNISSPQDSMTLPSPSEYFTLPSPKQAGSISTAEWRWLAKATLLILALLAIPYMISHVFPPQGYVLRGSFLDTGDLSLYLAAIREGSSTNSWLVYNHFTPENHQPALIYFSYVLVGKIAGKLGVGLAYFLFATASRVGLLVAAYIFVSTFLESVRWRRWAFLLIFFSSGFGFLFLVISVVFQNPNLFETYNVDLKLEDFNTFHVLFTHPHYALSLALLLLVSRSWFLYLLKPESRHLLATLFCLLAFGLVNPYSIIVVDAALVTTSFAHALSQRKSVRSALLPVLATLLVSLPILMYNFLTFVRDPFWSKLYWQQNAYTHITPTPLTLIAGYGLVLVLAALGVFARFQHRSPTDQFALFWIGTSLILAYMPFSFQRRMLFGVFPFLCLMAVHGWDYVTHLVVGTRRRLHKLYIPSVNFWHFVQPLAGGFAMLILIGSALGTYGTVC